MKKVRFIFFLISALLLTLGGPIPAQGQTTSLYGYVLDKNNQRFPVATVAFRLKDDGYTGNTQTRSDGSYEIALSRAGSFYVFAAWWDQDRRQYVSQTELVYAPWYQRTQVPNLIIPTVPPGTSPTPTPSPSPSRSPTPTPTATRTPTPTPTICPSETGCPVATGNLNGYVYDRTTNEPISNATVTGANRQIRTDSRGYYEILSLAPASWSFSAWASGYNSLTQTAAIRSGQATRLDFRLTASATPPPTTPSQSPNFTVKVKGCQSRPVAGQEVQFQRRKKNTSERWETIKKYYTGQDGTVRVETTSITLDFATFDYRVYAYKSPWVWNWEIINSNNYNGNLRNQVVLLPLYSEKNLKLNERIYSQAYKELEWSQKKTRFYIDKANSMTSDQLKEALEPYVNTYDSDYRKELRNVINKAGLEELRKWYVGVAAEMAHVKKYMGKSRYDMWCTAFATYVISQAGGPNVGIWGAAKFYDWFPLNRPKEVYGRDKEKYKTYSLLDDTMLSSWERWGTIPVAQGNIFLERVWGEKWTGHSAIMSKTQDFPWVETINGNAILPDNILRQGSVVVNLSEKYTRRHGSNTEFKAGKFECTQ